MYCRSYLILLKKELNDTGCLVIPLGAYSKQLQDEFGISVIIEVWNSLWSEKCIRIGDLDS